MSKRKPKLKNITADMDEEDYRLLYDKYPKYLDDITEALRDGRSPAEIGAYIRRKRPHKWVQSKIIEAAAKHMLRADKHILGYVADDGDFYGDD